MPPRLTIACAPSIIVLAISVTYGVACGGSVVKTGAGGASSGGGSLATCADSCSQDAVMSGCQGACDAIAKAGCLKDPSVDVCVMQCSALPSTLPACASAADDYLRCTQGGTPSCADGGAPMFPGCDTQQQALADCTIANFSLGGFGCSLTTNQCPNIPAPKGSASCSVSGSSGGGRPSTDAYQCQDGNGNTWAATCSGGTCTCTYNSAMSCTCTQSASMGTCGSCCPGAG
jgi:hypothetical protein